MILFKSFVLEIQKTQCGKAGCGQNGKCHTLLGLNVSPFEVRFLLSRTRLYVSRHGEILSLVRETFMSNVKQSFHVAKNP